MANRYTQITPSQFNPLSLNEIMMAPLTKQKGHENQQSEMAQMGMFDVNRLSVDDELIGGDINRMKQGVTDIEDQLLREGTSAGLSKKLMQAKRERQQYLSNDGAGGKAQNAYNAYQANAQALQGRKDLTSTQKQMGLQHALSQYTGVSANGSYSPYQGAESVNIEELASNRAKDMSAQEITEMTGWQKILRNGTEIWTNGTEERETLPREHIAQAIMNSLGNDISVQNYLQDAANIGMINDPAKYLENAAWNAADRFQVNNVKQAEAMKFNPTGKLKSNAEGVTQNGMNWNLINSPNDYKQENRATAGESLLNKINRGAEHPGISLISKPIYQDTDGVINPNYEVELAMYNAEKDAGGKKYSIDELPEPEKKRYKEIVKGLMENGRLQGIWTEADNLIGDPLENKQVQQKLIEYDEKYGNYTYNVKVISDTSAGVGNYSSGKASTDTASVLKQAQHDKFNQLFMDPQSGKVMNWEDLKEEYGDTVNVTMVQGYADVDNNLSTNLEGQKRYSDRKGEFASPMTVVLTDKDGNELPNFYMTRNRGQMNTPRYKADIALNDFFGKSRSLPEIKTPLKLGETDFQSSYLPEKTINEILNTMATDLNLSPEDGMPLGDFDEGQYEEYIALSRAMQMAGPRNGVYMLELDGKPGIKNYKTKQQIQAQKYKGEGLPDFQ